jgi:diguanylate cyclase
MRPNQGVSSPLATGAAPERRDPAGLAPDARLKSLPLRTYRFRVLGMGLGALPVIAVLREIDASWLAWGWVGFGCLVWPHLAFLLARGSRDPFRTERNNLLFDSAIAGSMASVMHFNLLPSVMLLTVSTADKINSGIRGLWWRALPGMVIALLLTAVLTGFGWRPETSLQVLLASLPILVIHTLAVSLSSYQLIRKVQKQNLRLDELHRIDTLTGLESRAHWQAQAEAALDQHQRTGQLASLMLVDVDRFKSINDRHGHATGDDVLRAIADVIRRMMPTDSHAGRLGGDEFAVLLPLDLEEAEGTAERIRAAVEALDFPRLPSLRCSISIGLAEPPAAGLNLREWSEAADRAMYRAKQAGRNRAASVDQIGAASD